MKLRNKKTGKVLDLECITVFDRPGKNDIGDSIDEFYTIAELNEEWEDYKPAEPLIKDEKVRKAVRAWAKLNRIDEVNYCLNDEDGSSLIYTTEASSLVLDFCFEIEELEFGKIYTIDKLCGEDNDD